jgi:TRAP-type transport system periplasmic protein
MTGSMRLLGTTATLAMLALGTSALLAGAGVLSGTAQAQELKMAHFIGTRHPMASRFMAPWAKMISDANVGGLTIRLYPGGQIGGKPPGAFKRVRNAISDIEFGLQGYTSSVFPRTLVTEVPLQWAKPSQATAALWRIFEKHVATEYKSVVPLALWNTDVPAIMTNKVVRRPEDLRGLKLRTPSKNQSEIIKALGAIPVAMPITQLYGAIEKGVVDGAMVPMSTIRSFKLAEVVKNFIIDLPFGYSPLFIVMNKKTFNSLSKAQQDLIKRTTGRDWSIKAAKMYERAGAGGIKVVQGRDDTSITVLTAEEKAAWRAKLEQIVADWSARFEKRGIPYRQILADFGKKAS